MKYLFWLCVVLIGLLANPSGSFIASNKSYNVYVGTTINDTVFKTVSLADNRNKFFADFDNRSKQPNEHLDYKLNLSEPQLLRINSIHPFSIPATIFIQPGDSVVFKMGKDKQLIFEGKNAAHYNFFQTLSDERYKYPKFDTTKGIWKYKEEVDLAYKTRILGFKKYCKDYTVSDAFIKTVAEYLEYEHYGWLLFSRQIPVQEIVKNPKYLNGISFNLFKGAKKKDNPRLYFALSCYLEIYSAINDNSEAYSAKKLEFLLKTINNNLSGEIQEYAITYVISDFEENLTPSNVNAFKNALQSAVKQIKSEHYKKELQKLIERTDKRGSELSKELLNAKLTDLKGNTITFEDILKSRGNSTKVIDFWASWCLPCIEGIKETYDIREKFTKEKNVRFIYFSTDKDAQKWRSRVEELEKSGINADHYLISRDDYALFDDYFSIQTIPRYIVLGHTNKTYVNSFPAPGTPEFEKVIENIQ